MERPSNMPAPDSAVPNAAPLGARAGLAAAVSRAVAARRVPCHVVVMGVAGCGKSTVAWELAGRLGWLMGDADDFHSPECINKMASGVPLDDEDRAPWLGRLNFWQQIHDGHGSNTVLACSALKRRYREKLAAGLANVVFVHLLVDWETNHTRMCNREHFMDSTMMRSQWDALEPLTSEEPGFTVANNAPVDQVVTTILQQLQEFCDPQP